MRRLSLSVPRIRGNEWRYVKECLDSEWVSSAGAFVDRFEERTASYMGARYAVSCVNGTSALHTALILSGIGEGDEVIVPTVTFIAPVNTIRYTNAYPVFMDCDEYLNIDMQKTEEFVKRECSFKTGKLRNRSTGRMIKAILPVHVFGNPVDIEPLMDLANKYSLKVIEDATESLGSYYTNGRYEGKKTGSIGDIGCLSFNGNKIITSGGGGMILTNSKKTADRARYLTTQAKDDRIRYIHNEIGYNYRLSNIQAAVGLAQLERLEEFVKIKRRNFDIYNGLVSDIDGLAMIGEPPYGFSNMWFYSLVIDNGRYGMSNMDLMKVLAKKGIESRPMWYLNHRQKQYTDSFSYKISNAEDYYKRILNLPSSVGLTRKNIENIVKVIRENAKN